MALLGSISNSQERHVLVGPRKNWQQQHPL